MEANLFLIETKSLLVKEKITSIYFESKQRYGSPRMTVNASLGSKVSKLQWLNMNQLGLRSKLSKKFKVTTILSIII
jgi:hypothetical protein